MRIVNKKAPAEFTILEKLEAGIALTGQEVKAVKLGHADLSASYVRIMNSEAHLVNAKIYPYQFARTDGYDEGRTRKLLLHKKQILALKSKMDQGNLTIIPTALYTTGVLIKLEIALVKGKKKFERKKELRQRDLDREAQEELKRFSRRG